MSNLSAMGKAMKMCSMDNNTCFPSNWADLVNYANNSKLWVCPSSHTSWGSITNLDQWADYILVANLKESDSPRAVLAFCPPKDHKGEGGNVLFIEGSVEWTRTEDFDALLSDPCRFFSTTDTGKVTELQHRVTIRPPYDSVLRMPVKNPPPR